MLEKLFKLKENGTTVKTEIVAGLTTFMTMAYILSLTPSLLAGTGMAWYRVFAAVAISSALACAVMGLYAKLPFCLAPGVGLGAFFTYTVCLGMGYSWQFALTAIFVEGIIFITLSILKVREAIVDSIPDSLKKAIGVGIGMFVAFIGLKSAGIVVKEEINYVALAKEWLTGGALVALIGVLVIGILLRKNVKGALLIGMLTVTIIGIPLGVTKFSGFDFFLAKPYFFEFAFDEIFASTSSVLDFFVIVFTFLFDDMFNTVGTLIGCAESSGFIREDGTIPNCGKALLSDAIGTTAGAILGCPTITTFVESSAGIMAGGRTGLTSLVTAGMFLISLFFAPIFASIPSAATASALIIVGALMIAPIRKIDFSEDLTEGIPAFLTIIIMVCTSNIPNGIMFGIFSYVLLKTFTGSIRIISLSLWVVTILFAINVFVSLI
ncbi:MAG: NCS2 family permease [Synergistaceae bacterium]|nr:NCS2 family permease [Synergistaceae bacterium]